MADVSFAGFRTFLEKYEAKSKKDKESLRDREQADQPMDILGGEEYHFVRGPKHDRANIYRKIKRTTPEILSAADVAGVKANYVPVKITPGLRGGTIDPIDAGAEMQATDDKMRDLDSNEIMRKLRKRHMKRKDMTTGVYDRPWGSAAAAAGGGGAPGAPAPPPI